MSMDFCKSMRLNSDALCVFGLKHGWVNELEMKCKIKCDAHG